MQIVVLVKHVPNPSGEPPEIGPDFLLRREEAPGGLCPGDEPGIATALRLTTEHGGEITALTVGPDSAEQALRKAMALGADRAVHVVDPLLRGADALVTATVLAAAIRRLPFDLVMAGVESSDGSTGTMPMTLAELLDVPCATFARRLEVGGSRLTIERQTSLGHDDVECDLPALATLTAGAAEARYASTRNTLAARRKPVERLTLADLGLNAAAVQSWQQVTAVEIAPAKQAGEQIDDIAQAVPRILQLLEEAGAV